MRQTDKDTQSIGARLRAARERSGDSRESAALRMDISPVSLQRYESGRREPGALVIVAFARRYDVTTDWLLLGRRAG